MLHKHAADALDAVCACFVQRLARGDVGGDLRVAQRAELHVVLLHAGVFVFAERHAHGGEHLVRVAR